MMIIMMVIKMNLMMSVSIIKRQMTVLYPWLLATIMFNKRLLLIFWGFS